MTDLESILQEEYEKVLHIKEKTEQSLSQTSDVEGKLRISTRRGQADYYHKVPNGKANGIYIPKTQTDFARKLAQKAYDEKVLELVTRREKQLKIILKDYKNDEVEKIFLKENAARQHLITPVEPTWQQKVDEWLSRPYHGKPFPEDAPIILTDRQERVRSKTEKDIANFFNRNHIPYKYECPLYLKPYGYVFPDFTLLSRKTGEEVYWEHEGLMDNPNYARNAVKKIDLYQSNDILMGDRLILTFETANSVLNTDTIRKLVEQYLL